MNRPPPDGLALARGSGGHGGRAGLRGDPGLQPERTALAWRRTVLSALVAMAVVAVAADRAGHVLVVVGAALTAAVVAALVVRQVVRARSAGIAPWPALVLASSTVLALAVLGLAATTASILGRLP